MVACFGRTGVGMVWFDEGVLTFAFGNDRQTVQDFVTAYRNEADKP